MNVLTLWIDDDDGHWRYALRNDENDEDVHADDDAKDLFTDDYASWIAFGVEWLVDHPGQIVIVGPYGV